MIHVVLLGYGNVGKHFQTVFGSTHGVAVTQVWSPSQSPRTEGQTQFINDLKDLKNADLYIFAVKDDAIRKLSQDLGFENRLVAHTSGTVGMKAIDAKNRAAVFYPLQTFSEHAKLDFESIPICYEAEYEADRELLQDLGNRISNTVQYVSSEDRKKLHLAATWVNNFTNHIFDLAKSYLEENQLDFDLLKPLIKETVAKIQEIDPHDAQTGPAKRGDVNTIENHLGMMRDPHHKEIYTLLTESIQQSFKSENIGKKL